MTDPRRLLIADADLLVRQYRNRSGLTLDQRKAWAKESAEVMERLVRELDKLVPAGPGMSDAVEWNAQFERGERSVTKKV